MVYYVNEGSVYAIAIIFPIISGSLVALRFIARKRAKQSCGLDDWTALASLLPLYCCAIVLIIGDSIQTIGYHSPLKSVEEDLTHDPPKQVTFLHLEYVFNPMQALGTGLIRLSLALLYRRIFRGTLFNMINLAVIYFVIVWTITFFFATWFTCSPVSAFWAGDKAYALHCANNGKILSALSVSDVFCDLILLFMPIVPVWKLQMKTSKKLAIIGLFSLGVFSVAAGLTKMVLWIELDTYPYGSNEKLFGLAGTRDVYGVVSTVLWWGFMELGVGSIVCNISSSVGLIVLKLRLTATYLVEHFSLSSLRSQRGLVSRSQSQDSTSMEAQPVESAPGIRIDHEYQVTRDDNSTSQTLQSSVEEPKMDV